MTTCKIDQRHCESCGSTSPEDLDGRDGYTNCCNELIAYGRSDCRDHHGHEVRWQAAMTTACRQLFGTDDRDALTSVELDQAAAAADRATNTITY